MFQGDLVNFSRSPAILPYNWRPYEATVRNEGRLDTSPRREAPFYAPREEPSDRPLTHQETRRLIDMGYDVDGALTESVPAPRRFPASGRSENTVRTVMGPSSNIPMGSIRASSPPRGPRPSSPPRGRTQQTARIVMDPSSDIPMGSIQAPERATSPIGERTQRAIQGEPVVIFNAAALQKSWSEAMEKYAPPEEPEEEADIPPQPLTYSYESMRPGMGKTIAALQAAQYYNIKPPIITPADMASSDDPAIRARWVALTRQDQ